MVKAYLKLSWIYYQNSDQISLRKRYLVENHFIYLHLATPFSPFVYVHLGHIRKILSQVSNCFIIISSKAHLIFFLLISFNSSALPPIPNPVVVNRVPFLSVVKLWAWMVEVGPFLHLLSHSNH